MPNNNFQSISKSELKLDGMKLAQGKGTFTDDFTIPGMLYAKLLYSPHPHARIIEIDTRQALAIPGVHSVLCYKNVKRIPYTTAGQGYPEPSPYDNFLFDKKVRYVGDRVAAVAAETPEIAEEAVKRIMVKYELLPAILDPKEAMSKEAPIIHDEPDSKGLFDPSRNLAAYILAEVGNIKEGFANADLILEGEYSVHQVQQAPLEPHVTITYIDEDGRLVIRSSTQVPFHCRRIVAHVLGIPVKQIRVIKPRIGGGFGAKQEILNEEVCAALTLATKHPVRLKLTRQEEFISTRTRHPQILHIKSGVKKDGTITAISLSTLGNTGAYGSHSLTVHCVTGTASLSHYRIPHIRYEANVVYTNLPVAGAFRGYGAPQGFFAVESHIDELAKRLKMDPLTLRQQNAVREGDHLPIREVLGEGKEGFKQVIFSCGALKCFEEGSKAIEWGKTDSPSLPYLRRGKGMAFVCQGSGIPGVDMGAASIKINEDGSFNLLVGAADIGTGADTTLAQIAAEVLTVSPQEILVYSADTDITPFDVGAYASSTTYISGSAVKKAAEEAKKQILLVAGNLLNTNVSQLTLIDGKVVNPQGNSISLQDVAYHSLYKNNQFQIIGTASHVSHNSPPPFAAQFAEVEVDIETGIVKVIKFVSAVDCGIPINPLLAEGQIEGAVAQGLGYALTEEYIFDANGAMINPNLSDYKIFAANDMPELKTILVTTYEPTGPFGAKSVAEIGISGAAPAIANAIENAIGVRMRSTPFTPEKVLAAIEAKAKKSAPPQDAAPLLAGPSRSSGSTTK